MIGQLLTNELLLKGHNVRWLTRKKKEFKNVKQFEWDVATFTMDEKAIEGVDVIFHLAGSSVAGKRWDLNYKKDLYDSRIQSAILLAHSCQQVNHFPKHFISSSAIGYYGFDRGNELIDESSSVGDDFLAKLVFDWEAAVDQFKQYNTKVTKMRTGIVLSEKGGALSKMTMPIRYGIGAPLASGNQYLSWVHQTDVVNSFVFVMEKELEGIFNQVAPNPVTNREFTYSLAKMLKRPILLPPIPGFILKLTLGEFAEALIGGVKIEPKNLEKEGYVFFLHDLNDALKNLLYFAK